MKKLTPILLFLFTILFACNNTTEAKKVKNIILLIGDGMSVNQIYATELYSNIIHNKGLAMNNMAVKSFMTTHSANNYTTCSSAAITAMACGYKTNNGVLCKDTSLTIQYETIAEKLKRKGYRIGIISSVYLNHATPAGFYAHQNSRKYYYEIGKELPASKFNYFGGGGIRYPRGNTGDSANIFDQAKATGYKISKTHSEFNSITKADTMLISINPEVYRYGDFYWSIDKRKGALSLADFTKQALNQLNNENGFFLMVEGGKIDWACHKNDAASCIHEMLDFDKAVGEAITFYNQYPDETIVIVLGDHETGGMSLGTNENVLLGNIQLQLLENQKISTQEFDRLLQNVVSEYKQPTFNQVMDSVSKYFGFNNGNNTLTLNTDETEWLNEAFQTQVLKGLIATDYDYLFTNNKSFTARVIHILNQKAGIGWTTNDHTPMPIPVRVTGIGHEYFKPYIDNTELAGIIEQILY